MVERQMVPTRAEKELGRFGLTAMPPTMHGKWERDAVERVLATAG